jgi:hypothetical protein
MDLVIDAQGRIQCIYGEAIPLHNLGEMAITRASHVEPDPQGRWWADLSPVGGPSLGPFARRSQALNAEIAWLEHWLTQTRSSDASPTVTGRAPSKLTSLIPRGEISCFGS